MSWLRRRSDHVRRAQEAAEAPPPLAKVSERRRQYIVSFGGLAMDADQPANEWDSVIWRRQGAPGGQVDVYPITVANTEVTEVGWGVIDWSLLPNGSLTQGLYGRSNPPSDNAVRVALYMSPETSGHTDGNSQFLTDIPLGLRMPVRIPVPRDWNLVVMAFIHQMQAVVSGGPNGLPLALGVAGIQLTVDP